MRARATGTITLLALLAQGLGGCDAARDSTPPQVVAITPADGARRIEVSSVFVVQFSEPVDPGTVNRTTVSLRAASDPVGAAVATRLAWNEAARSVTVTPVEALAWASTFELLVDGVRDRAGHAAPPARARVSTYENPLVRAIAYRNSQVSHHTRTDLDPQGRLVRSVWYGAAGPDGRWFSPDDVPMRWTAFVGLAGAGGRRAIDFANPGEDGQWLTADDAVQSWSEERRDAGGRIVRWSHFTGPGADRVWQTADDEAHMIVVTDYDDAGREVRRVTYLGLGGDGLPGTADDGAGPDGAWGTPDDQAWDHVVVERDARGLAVRELCYDGPGPDGRSLTADDRLAYWRARWFDDAGDLLFDVDYDLAGVDGVWLTDDDEATWALGFSRDETGLAVRTSWYERDGRDGVPGTPDDGAGLDGRWRTADDVPSDAELVVTGLDGLLDRRVFLGGAGPDGRWGTGDDVPTGRTDRAVRADDRLAVRQFVDPGLDATWLTADDQLGALTLTLVDTRGNRVEVEARTGPGPDGAWETPDDLVSSRTHYDPGW